MKFDKGLSELNHEKIIGMIENIGNISNNIIYKNYFSLFEFVKRNINNLDKINLLGIAHMVYGWMPTMLDNVDETKINDENKISIIWDNIFSGSLDSNFLYNIQKITNNSIRGGSKLLHFINPNKYAIFDSKVYKAITKDNSYNYDYNYSIKKYKLYMEKLKLLEGDVDNMNKIKNEFHKNNEKDDRITNLRYLELCLYFSER